MHDTPGSESSGVLIMNARKARGCQSITYEQRRRTARSPLLAHLGAVAHLGSVTLFGAARLGHGRFSPS